MGHPPAAIASRLTTVTARLVDRGRAPDSTGRSFAGLHHSSLFGRPPDGGFGALPWQQHISARHACWAARLISAPLSPAECPPWVAIARLLMRDLPPAGLLSWLPGRALPGAMAPLPQPLHRLHSALALLPPVSDVGSEPLAPGPWCLSIPLWGNPALTSPSHPDGIDVPFTDFLAAGVSTVGCLLAVERAELAAVSQAVYERDVRGPLLRGSYAFAQRYVARERVEQLLAALPAEWVAAARQALAAPADQLAPTAAAVLAAMLLPRVGWQPPGREPLTVASLTVRAATAMLTAEVAAARAARYLAPFAALAAGAPPPPPLALPPPLPPPPASPLAELLAAMRRLWRLPWENGRKEAFWRLAYDALPTAARLHTDEPCPCGAADQRPGRQHHFWDCPVARGVIGQLEAACAVAAAPAPPPAPLVIANVWLARPPPGIHAGVWGVVCLAAVEATAHGMRRLTGLRLRWRERQQQQQQQPQQQQPQQEQPQQERPQQQPQQEQQQQQQQQPRLVQLSLDSFLQPGGDEGGGPPAPQPLAPSPAHAAPDPNDPSEFPALASRAACKFFWTLLSDFAALGCAPSAWLDALSHSHPFFRIVDGRLQLRPLPPIP